MATQSNTTNIIHINPPIVLDKGNRSISSLSSPSVEYWEAGEVLGDASRTEYDGGRAFDKGESRFGFSVSLNECSFDRKDVRWRETAPSSREASISSSISPSVVRLASTSDLFALARDGGAPAKFKVLFVSAMAL